MRNHLSFTYIVCLILIAGCAEQSPHPPSLLAKARADATPQAVSRLDSPEPDLEYNTRYIPSSSMLTIRHRTIGKSEAGQPWRGGVIAAEGDEVWGFYSDFEGLNSGGSRTEGLALVRKRDILDGVCIRTYFVPPAR